MFLNQSIFLANFSCDGELPAALESCAGELHWRAAMESCAGELRWRAALESCAGELRWRAALESSALLEFNYSLNLV
jgi:hypothetical protein